MESHRENSNHTLCFVPEIKILKNRTSHTCQTPVRPPGARQRHSHRPPLTPSFVLSTPSRSRKKAKLTQEISQWHNALRRRPKPDDLNLHDTSAPNRPASSPHRANTSAGLRRPLPHLDESHHHPPPPTRLHPTPSRPRRRRRLLPLARLARRLRSGRFCASVRRGREGRNCGSRGYVRGPGRFFGAV